MTGDLVIDRVPSSFEISATSLHWNDKLVSVAISAMLHVPSSQISQYFLQEFLRSESIS